MTPPDTILQNMRWALPLSAVLGLAVGGVTLAFEVALVAAVMLLNLQFLRFIADRYVQSIATGLGGGIWGAALSGKLLITLAVMAVVLQWVQPLAVAIGLVTVFSVLPLAGVIHSVRVAPVSLETR